MTDFLECLKKKIATLSSNMRCVKNQRLFKYICYMFGGVFPGRDSSTICQYYLRNLPTSK